MEIETETHVVDNFIRFYCLILEESIHSIRDALGTCKNRDLKTRIQKQMTAVIIEISTRSDDPSSLCIVKETM